MSFNVEIILLSTKRKKHIPQTNKFSLFKSPSVDSLKWYDMKETGINQSLKQSLNIFQNISKL